MNDSNGNNQNNQSQKELKQLQFDQSEIILTDGDNRSQFYQQTKREFPQTSNDSEKLLKDLEGMDQEGFSNQENQVIQQKQTQQQQQQLSGNFSNLMISGVGLSEQQQYEMNDSKDMISMQRDALKAEIFSPEILEEIQEYFSDDEDIPYNQKQQIKRQLSANKRRRMDQHMNQIAQSIENNQGDEERKIMRMFVDDDVVEDEYTKATQAFFGKKEKKKIELNENSPLKNRKLSQYIPNLQEIQKNHRFALKDLHRAQLYNKKTLNQGIDSYVARLQQVDKHIIHKHSPTKVKKKNIHEFDLFLVQEIRAHSDSIWVARFSPCGNFMATGGKDAVLRIWQVNCVGKQDSVDVTFADCWKVFHKAPYREYREHEHDILDITWCKERPNLLLSCSLDQKVILWDLNKERHMQIFEHPDIPVKIQFNPELDNLFVSGSLDKGVRLWSIDEKSKPIDTMQTSDCITAIQFSENGKRIVVGLSSGQCVVYSCDNIGRLNYITRIDCKNRRGKFSSGRKVSGIVFINKTDIIITTNDSRLRHYNLEDCIQKYKYKGHKNENLQIEASISDDQEYIISGSEDGYVYIWNRIQDIPTAHSLVPTGGFQKNKIKAYECFMPFENEKIITPVAILAPKETIKLQLIKYIRIAHQNFQNCLKSMIIACSIDGRIRVYVNEKYDGLIQEEDEFEDYEGIEVSVREEEEIDMAVQNFNKLDSEDDDEYLRRCNEIIKPASNEDEK